MGIHDRGYYRDDDERTGLGGMMAGVGRTAVAMLIVANVVIYLLDMFTTRPDGRATGLLMSYLALEGDAAWKPWKLWQVLTYGFAHAPLNSQSGIWHILFNMFGLFVFGRPVEQRYGKAEFLRFYGVALVFSGLCWLLWVTATGRLDSSIVGASGGVVAVTMLFVFNFPREKLLLFGIVPIEARYLGLIFVALEIMNSLNPNSMIGWQAHLAGMLLAALYFHFGWNFSFLGRWRPRRPRVRIHRDPDEQLKQEADRLLAKIHAEGEASLSRRERKTLEKYSRRMREQRQSTRT